VIGFQARRLRDDDPLRGKYVNTPESELFKKGSVLYGLHLARPAIAKQDRAIVVEGNTDVIALRQAEVEPVVASMGTALTEQQVRELGRLTKRLFLCFDADAAGQEATLRGMELAVQQGFDVRVVTLPKGEDPADAPDSFTARLGAAESYLHYRVRIALERAGGRQEGFVQAREILAPFEDSPERQEALRLVADRLDLPRETLAGLAPARTRGTGGSAPPATPRLLEAGLQRERDLLAAVVRNPSLLDELAALTPEHFDDPLHRRFREALVAGGPEDEALVALGAELGARGDRVEIDERTGKELILRLHERRLRRELQGAGADLVRATELQARLTKVHSALAELV
jgi:DNA primase